MHSPVSIPVAISTQPIQNCSMGPDIKSLQTFGCNFCNPRPQSEHCSEKFEKKIMHLCKKSKQKAEIFLSPVPRGKSCIFVRKNDMFKLESSFDHFQRLI